MKTDIDINKITTALDAWDILKAAGGLLVAIVGFIVIFSRSAKVFWRLGKNLGKKVFIFCPPGGKRNDGGTKDMERELGVLKSSGYFNVSKGVVTDFHAIDQKDIDEAGIIILGYHRGMNDFDDFFQMVRRADKPLIIYTFEIGYQLDDKHKEIIKDYKWYALSSMPLRLVSDIFSIMSSYRYEPRRS
ncbi:hypothetical protein C4578_00745 [Candidatus Microgenomates bacterium]|jgi:hypothetical protein|nr:MAG: hypothetical protein C4578_00745 [Candidatus Microgenomates bacterium]